MTQTKDPIAYLTERGMSLDEMQTYIDKGLKLEEVAASVASMLERGEDWRAENNYTEVYSHLTKSKKKINGELVELVSCTAENFLNVLRLDNHFQCVKYNTLRGLPERHTGNKKRVWTDADDASARTYIEATYHISSRPKYDDAFAEFQHEREFDPIHELISQLEWDGQKRVETFFIKWLGAEDTPYSRECARLVFAGGINRAYRAGCKFDDVIVLIGKQGGGKSTVCQWLALSPELYSSTKTINGQRGLESTAGKWVIELEELLATLANEQAGTKSEEAAKAFLSTASDFYRKPYDRRPTDTPRRCIFIGTTNRSEFLTDKTGNRRWYPVKVQTDGHWLYEHEKECKADILQCWAEMKAAFDAGDTFSQPVARVELLSAIREKQAEAEQDDWRVGVMESYLQDKTETCLLEIWKNALYADRSPNYPEMRRKNANEISAILVNQLGWVRGNVKLFSGFGKQKSYYSPTANEELDPL